MSSPASNSTPCGISSGSPACARIASRRQTNGTRRAPRQLRGHGFTIIELIVAAAITLVVLGLMVQVTFAVLKTFDKVTGSLTTKTQATTALEYLRRDFKSIVWKRDRNVWLLATVQRDQDNQNGGRGDTNIATADWSPTSIPAGRENPKPGNANPGSDFSSLRLRDPAVLPAAKGSLDLDEYRFGQAGVWLRFFSTQVTSNTSLSVPVAVGYQIVRIKPQQNSTEYRYQLYRSVVEPGPQAVGDFSVLSAGYDLASNAGNGYNNITGIGSTPTNGLPASIRKPDRKVLLGNNVIDFGVRFWQKNSVNGELNLVFPADTTVSPSRYSNINLAYAATSLAAADIPGLTTADATGAQNIPYGDLANADLNTGFPDFADIFLRILTDEGARILEAYENGKSDPPPQPTGDPLSLAQWKAKHWWTLALEHSEVFVERIPITARPF